MSILRFILFGSLLAFLPACNVNQQASITNRPVSLQTARKAASAHTLLKQTPADLLSRGDDYWQRSPEEILRDLDAIALANLAGAIADPMESSHAQPLLASPEEAQKMFAECGLYWRDLFSEPEDEQPDWTIESLRKYTEYFLDRVKATRVYEVEAGKYLLSMTCGSGPYWVATIQFLYTQVQNKPHLQTLSLPLYDAAANRVVENPSNINRGIDHYDQGTQILTQSHKYAGHGLCGREAKYRLEGDRFVLIEFRENPDCSLPDMPIETLEYPQLYP